VLFDLRGKRRRVIQVVYACLAILMGGSLVLFGIGSDAPGGIFDGLGLTDGGGSTDPRYEEEIDAAEATLATDPENQEALLTLARYRYLSATTGIVTNPETGQREVSADAREQLDEAIDAWNRYLETEPARLDADIAINMAQLNEIRFDDALGQGDAAGGLAAAEDAVEAYEVAAERDGTAVEFAGIARYAYIAGLNGKGDRALQQAVRATDPEDREDIEQTLNERAREAKQLSRELQRIVEQGDSGTGAIEDPFGGLDGGGSVLEP